MIESEGVARFVWARLAADAGAGGVATLVDERIDRDRVPQGVPLPAVTIGTATAVDFNTANGVHVGTDVEIDVAVHGDGATFDEIAPIAARIFAVLQEAGGVHDDVYVVQLRRTDAQQFVSTDEGKSYAQIVQTFYTEAEPA